MKLRFRANSLRLRVDRREVAGLAAGTPIEEQVDFPGEGRICYVLEGTPSGAPRASFHNSVIRVSAPEEQIREWARSDLIGIYFELPANGTLLKVAIEKDLECLEGAEEEREPNAFPRAGRNC